MATTATTYIGLKRLWYGNVITETLNKQKLETWLTTAKEIKNVHEDTWKFSQEEPTKEEYINELDGESYYIDETKKGKKMIEFTIGQWEVDDRVALAGGSKDDLGWIPPLNSVVIEKAFVAQTKNGNFIIFSKGNVSTVDDTQKKNIGLGVKVTALSNGAIPPVRFINGKTINVAG